MLGRFVDVMERNPTVGLVFCRSVELHGEEERGICRWADCGEEDRIWSDRSFFLHLIEGNCIVASSVMVRKECYPNSGPYQLDLPFATDWYIWCLVALHWGVAYFSEPMVYLRIHEESLTALYTQDHARICIGDEVGTLLRVGEEAKQAEQPSLVWRAKGSPPARSPIARSRIEERDSGDDTDRLRDSSQRPDDECGGQERNTGIGLLQPLQISSIGMVNTREQPGRTGLR